MEMITTLNNAFTDWFANYGPMMIIFVLIIAAFVVMMVFQSKKRKKQEKEAKDLIDAVKPGNKVKTIGGICGIVVEVDAEENTFVLETGSVTAGKSYVKFDRQAIWQTDAVVKPEEGEGKEEEISSEPAVPETGTPAENNTETRAEEPAQDGQTENAPAPESENN